MIEIRPPNRFTDNNWSVRQSFNDEEKVDGESVPHSMGFYHYPEHESVDTAFDKLRTKMVVDIQKEIDRLQKDLELLKELKLIKKKDGSVK